MDATPILTSDATLAAAWAAGDEAGYAGLVARYAPLVYARCRRALGSADADDATQAVFLVLARRRGQAAANPALAAWLMQVTGHVLRNALRDRRRRRRAETQSPPPPPGPERDAMEQDEIRRHLDAALDELPAAEAEAIRLHHLAGHTVAEVATHVGAAASTVCERMQRGRERLRRALARRGVGLGAALLAAALTGEASAAVPSALLGKLQQLGSSTPTAPTATGLSVRVLAWAQIRRSPMTTYAMLAAGALLVGSVYFMWPEAAEPEAPALTPDEVAVEAAGVADAARVDQARAITYFEYRVNDIARSVSRLEGLPEAAMVPDEWRQRITTAVDGMGCLTMRGAIERAVLEAELEEQTADAMRESGLGGSCMDATLRTSGPDALVHSWLRALPERFADGQNRTSSVAEYGVLDMIFGLWLPIIPTDPEHEMPDLQPVFDADGLGGRLSSNPNAPGYRIDGDLIRFRGSERDDAATLSWLDGRVGGDASADLELHMLVDPRDGGAPLQTAVWTVRIGATGLDLRGWMPYEDEAAQEEWSARAQVDRTWFDGIPADVIGAVAIRLTPGSVTGSRLWQMLVDQVQDTEFVGAQPQAEMTAIATIKAIAMAVTTGMDAADGHLGCWVQANPGVPVPAITVGIDCPTAAAEQMMVQIAALVPGWRKSSDGALTRIVEFGQLHLGHRNGRLLLTTHPDGLAGCQGTGFAHIPEVAAALQDMPAGGLTCAVARPAALVAQLAPFATLSGNEALNAQVAHYQQALSSQSMGSWLHIATARTGVTTTASGLLSAAALATLASVIPDLDAAN